MPTGKTIIHNESIYLDRSVIIANETDDWYKEEVGDWKRINEIIVELRAAATKAFGPDNQIRDAKVSKEAIAYINSNTRFAIWDNSDDMHQQDIDEARFKALTGDEVEIKNYIRAFHKTDFVKLIQSFIDLDGLEESDLESTASSLIFEYDEFKNELKFP